MKLKRIVVLLAMLSVAVFSLGMATPVAAAALFTQCPPVGLDTGCAALIQFNPDGSRVTLVDPSQRPFDGFEDTLVGVQNNSSSSISSLVLDSAAGSQFPIFDFDGDGLCSIFTSPRPALCPFGTTGYEGPGTSFTNISLDRNHGTVNFSPSIQPGGSAYFSLEGPTASIAPPTKASPTITTQATNSALGGTISDTATLSGGTVPTGTITFKLFGPNNPGCTLLAFTSIKTVSGNGPNTSAAFTPLLLGTYRWVATYSGDANNNPANTACGASGETSTVTKASPTITTRATATATVGGTISDTATLAGGATPTGTITFKLFGPNNPTCTLLVFTSIKTVSGNGNYTSAPFLVLPPGTYRWVASYSGDANNNPANTACGASGETSIVTFFFAPGGGSFVIGDENAAVGNSVTFWGAQWAKDNSLSGGSAPSSFKGFAESPTTPSCGAGWSADPGNSTPPPDGPLPAFMGVIVTSSADKSGSTISGNTVHIVIVQTNPGYAPDPGHAGTGTVVAGVC